MTPTHAQGWLSIDIGGTFTDVIAAQDTRRWVEKVLSTPSDPCVAVGHALERLAARGVALARIGVVVHASTVATNAILEGRGPATALLTTAGFRDVLEIGRLRMPAALDFSWQKPAPLVPRWARIEITERISGRGAVLTPLAADDVAAAAERLRAEGVASLAICFLNSYLNPVHEQRAAEIVHATVGSALSISCSVDVLREVREYERTSTTVVNAYVKPVIDAYLSRLAAVLAGREIRCPVHIMQSHGGVTTLRGARRLPVTLIESGPCAGVLGAAGAARERNLRRVISFDMGGTTAKAALIDDGEPSMASSYEVGGGINTAVSALLTGQGFPIAVSSIDVSEVGAGGGSIAWVDEQGVLRVGPRSAGADPGPACYGRGGTDATVTDADVVLGLLDPTRLSDRRAGAAQGPRLARAAVAEVGDAVGLTPEAAARAIVDLAHVQMLVALRSVTVHKGIDPHDCAVVAFGGAGPLHGCGIAELLKVSTVVVPPTPGLYSAVGLTHATLHTVATQSTSVSLDDPTAPDQVRSAVDAVVARAAREADSEDAPTTDDVRIDVRLRGQAHAISLPVTELAHATAEALRVQFAKRYQDTYGYDVTGRAAEVTRVVVRVATGEEIAGRSGRTWQPPATPETGLVPGWRDVRWTPGQPCATPVLGRSDDRLAAGLDGPVLIEEYDTVVAVPPRWRAQRDETGTVVLTRDGIA